MDRVGIVGSGTMGIEIAQAAAEHGFKVIIYDLTDEIVLSAIRRLQQRLHKKVEQGRYKAENMNLVMLSIHPVTSLIELNECDIVIEAVPESLTLKQQIFEGLEKVCKTSAVLATNTSSLSITAIAGKMKSANRVVGCHFFNPASIMKLVEVIPGMMTDDVTVKAITDFVTSLHKEPVEAKDTPGFIVNRVARSFY
ncbi:MAG: 3-hydroxyacyl-CoA dehydrogenase NAD-binding domain-containing protein, partial [Bacilli bacterium]